MKKLLLLLITPILLISSENYVKSWKSGLVSYSLGRKLYNTTIEQETALRYLNSLREKAGLTTLSKNQYLQTASQNHVNYMASNNAPGHREYSGYSNFTGEWPSDRAVYAGYKSRMVSENLSYGQNDVNESIDGLFSAIYHRLGFLDTTINEIGIGLNQSQKFYNFDMGNTYLNELCNGTSFEGEGQYTYEVCADENLKISLTDFNNAKNNISKNNPKIILWPYKNATNIPPVFFEESPDPLPDSSVSGYPISVSFNQYFYPNPPTFISFKIYDSNDNEITNTLLLDSQNDPNNELDEYHFVLFPLNRLRWGRVYKAVFDYDDGNGSKEISWSFKTKTLPFPYYEIGDSNNQTLNLISGKTYAIYFAPRNNNDNLGGYDYSYESGVNMDSDYIDADTIKIKLTGAVGQKATLNFNNGRSLTLKIANSDSAITEEENLSNVDDNSTDSFDFSSLSDDEKLRKAIDPLYYDEIMSIIQKRESEKFNEGLEFVKSNPNDFNLTTINNVTLSKDKIDGLQNGWTLLGSSLEVSDLSIFADTKIVWIYDKSTSSWMAYSPDETTREKIESGGYRVFSSIPDDSGIWVLK